MYFYEEDLFSQKQKKYLLSGWFACIKNCTIKEILLALNWQINKKNKNIKWIAFIKKNNYFSLKLSKYIGWKDLNKKYSIIKFLSKKYKIKSENFIFQER